ncbi:hypothetical protein J2W50_000105 [Herbaspirillum frisingense]|uniref:Uncharacterized protein n=1 Tax=Herbaspirillum frisingense TaxID=92645 RepID=A0ABU1P7P8_9BURK|nr:hypothetical protein [Herbaspirillum frisingense]
MAELSWAGTSMREMMSCASTRESALRMASFSTVSMGVMKSWITAWARATVMAWGS